LPRAAICTGGGAWAASSVAQALVMVWKVRRLMSPA